MSRIDFEQLADEYLDGALTGSEWEKLLAEHGETLHDAVKRAEARRDAMHSLPRQPMPAHVRAGIAAALAARKEATPPLRWSWRAVLPFAVAAGLVYAISLTHQASDQAVPHQERAKSDAPAAPQARVPQALSEPALAMQDKDTSADREAKRETNGAPAEIASSLRKSAESDQLARLENEARAFSDTSASAALAAGKELAPGPLALALSLAQPPASAPAAADAKAKPGKKSRLRLDTSEPTIQIALTNRTVTELTVENGQLTLHGLDTAGKPVWTAPIALAKPVNVPAGQTVEIQQALSGDYALPAVVAQLFVNFGSDRSAPMTLPEAGLPGGKD